MLKLDYPLKDLPKIAIYQIMIQYQLFCQYHQQQSTDEPKTEKKRC